MSTVLIGDDDESVCESLRRLFAANGIATDVARSGHESIVRARTPEVRLLVIDCRLPDMTGVEVVRALRADGVHLPFILITGYATIPLAVEAMQLGAVHVVEKPVRFAHLLTVVRRVVDSPHLLAPTNLRGASATERWARWVIAAVDSPRDLKTLGGWARLVGVGYSSLREGCYLVGVQPHDARDFARALRIAARVSSGYETLDELVDVSDRRSLNAFCDRASLVFGGSPPNDTLKTFWREQKLIPDDNRGFVAVRELFRQGDRG